MKKLTLEFEKVIGAIERSPFTKRARVRIPSAAKTGHMFHHVKFQKPKKWLAATSAVGSKISSDVTYSKEKPSKRSNKVVLEGSSQDLTALGRKPVFNNFYNFDYELLDTDLIEEDTTPIVLRETISSTDNNVYVAFILKDCTELRWKNYCVTLKTDKIYDEKRGQEGCTLSNFKRCNIGNYYRCRDNYSPLQNKDIMPKNSLYRNNNNQRLFSECKLNCGACWTYKRIDAMCGLSTMRIVNGFIICVTVESYQYPFSLAKIDMTTGKIITERRILTKNSCTSLNKKCIFVKIDIEVMVDNANIWILYNGKSNGILEQLHFKTLFSVKTVRIEHFNSDNRAIVVSNKLYILSISGDQLSIIKAIDTDNPKNKMSRKVTLLKKFENGTDKWIHYNPRLGQLFVSKRKTRKTEIYEIETCKYAFPKYIDFEKIPIQSTFLWSLYPNSHEHYIYIIKKISSFLKIKNYKHLKIISSILLTCPYTKCKNSNSENDLYCRLNIIRSLFESFTKYKDPAFSTPLQVHFDMVKLLEQSQFHEMSSKLKGLQNLTNRNLINIKKKIQDLLSSLGLYFTTFVNFDSKKSKSDLELFYSLYNDLNSKQNKIASTIKNKLSTLLRQATESNMAEKVGRLLNVAIASTAYVNPFCCFCSINKMLQLQDGLAAVAKTIVNSVKFDKINKVYFTRLRKIGDDLKIKIISTSKAFPNLKTLINKAMNKMLNEKELSEYVDVFLKEYDLYKPAFEPSTIDEYETILSEIVDELCRIIYEGKTLASATVQGVLASKNTCLATKIDVQTLMGLYRDMYEKQDFLMESFASAVRATAVRLNSERIRNIPNQISNGQFEETETNYRFSILEMLINSMIHQLFIIREACTLIRYKNGNVMPKYCTDAIENGGISDSVISSRLNRDMCDGVNIRKFVYIPAQQQSVNSSIPNGTIDLTRLYRGDEVVFQIPNSDWLIEHKWIYGDKKDKVIVLKEFELYIPANRSSEILVKSTKRFISQNIIKPGGNNYYFSAPKLYQYNFEYSQGTYECAEPMMPSTPYELPSCPKLPKICVTSKGKLSHSSVYPSIYSKFGIKLTTSGNIQEPHPKTKFYLIASVTFCIVEPLATKRKRSQTIADTLIPNLQIRKAYLNKQNESHVCCGEYNKYYDPLSLDNPCKPCPNKSTARFHGLYCD